MGKTFNLEITLDYNMNTPYSDILLKGHWVRGFAVSFTATIANKSDIVFPGTLIKVILDEHSSLRDSDLIYTFTPLIAVPSLEPDAYIKSPEYEYFPQSEGICNIIFESGAFKRNEILISGSMQRTSVRNRISQSFFVVRWQELEIIHLLRRILESKE